MHRFHCKRCQRLIVFSVSQNRWVHVKSGKPVCEPVDVEITVTW